MHKILVETSLQELDYIHSRQTRQGPGIAAGVPYQVARAHFVLAIHKRSCWDGYGGSAFHAKLPRYSAGTHCTDHKTCAISAEQHRQATHLGGMGLAPQSKQFYWQRRHAEPNQAP